MKKILYTFVVFILIVTFAILIYLIYRQKAVLFPGEFSQKNEIENIQEGEIESVFPKGGESYCFGDEMDIQWKAKDTKIVKITLKDVGSSNSYNIDSVAENYDQDDKGISHYKWKVGDVKAPTFTNKKTDVNEGNTYEIVLMGSVKSEHQNAISTEKKRYVPAKVGSEGVFSIKYCESEEQKNALNIEDWQKYTKSKHFSVKYPKNWSATYNSYNDYVEFRDENKKYFDKETSEEIAPIRIYIYSGSSYTSSASYLINQLKSSDKNAIITNPVIDSVQAYKTEYNGGMGVAISKNGKTYVMSIYKLTNASDYEFIKKVYNNLIETFEFE